MLKWQHLAATYAGTYCLPFAICICLNFAKKFSHTQTRISFVVYDIMQ